MAKITRPASRLTLAQEKGQVPSTATAQSGKFFPATAAGLKDPVAPADAPNSAPPRDGQIASAGQDALRVLDEPGRDRWTKHTVKSGQELEITWNSSKPVKTRGYNYFITKDSWTPDERLSRDQLEPVPFFKVQFSEAKLVPEGPTTHKVTLPRRSGTHVVLAIWEVADTGAAFYQTIDFDFVRE